MASGVLLLPERRSTSRIPPPGIPSSASPTPGQRTAPPPLTPPPQPRNPGPRFLPAERGEILRRAFELVTERAEDFALLMTLEMGKPLAEARGEVTYGAEFLRWFSEEAVRAFGRYSVSPDGKSRLLVRRSR